jgi:hypothetical protein
MSDIQEVTDWSSITVLFLLVSAIHHDFEVDKRFVDFFALLKQELHILEKLAKLQNWPKKFCQRDGPALIWPRLPSTAPLQYLSAITAAAANPGVFDNVSELNLEKAR